MRRNRPPKRSPAREVVDSRGCGCGGGGGGGLQFLDFISHRAPLLCNKTPSHFARYKSPLLLFARRPVESLKDKRPGHVVFSKTEQHVILLLLI